MLKAYIFLVFWLIVACNCRSLESRARISSNNEDEHVHIKLLLPKVLRKHKLPRHTIRPHYAKRLPTHNEAISWHNVPQQQQTATTNQAILSQQHHDDFQLPVAMPMPMLTTEHEMLAHIAATSPLADNDIRHNRSIRTQWEKQKQKRTPIMMPPPPLSSPMMAQYSYGDRSPEIFSSTLLDGNIITADEFLREVQQLYGQKYGAAVTPALMMEPQMQALTKTTTSTPTTTRTRKKPKKRKHNKNFHNNHFHFGKPAISQQYYAKEQQQQQQQQNMQQDFKPLSSKQAYSNYYYYDDYNNNKFFDTKNTKFSIIDPTPMGANEPSTDNTSDDIDANSSSTEDYAADSVSDTVMAFTAPIHPEEPSSFLSSPSPPYSFANNMQTNKNNNYYNTYNGYGYGDGDSNDDDDDNEDDNVASDGGFNPISYQDLYATYSATPAAHHLSTMPTRLKYKRQQHQGQPLREQFVQLSSIAPVVSTGINTLRSTQRAPTTTATSFMGEIGNIYGAAQQPLERYSKRKNNIKVKRNRLMVQ